MSRKTRRALIWSTAAVMAIILSFVLTACDFSMVKDKISDEYDTITNSDGYNYIRDQVQNDVDVITNSDLYKTTEDYTRAFLDSDFCKRLDEELEKIGKEVTKKWDECVDGVVTIYANSIYRQAQERLSLVAIDRTKSFENVEEINLSQDDEYVYDAASFAYRLIMGMIPAQYTSFPASLQFDGKEIIGIAYTDYKEAYQTESGKKYYESGFIAYDGEETISEDDFTKGLEIIPVFDEAEGSDSSYVFTLRTEAFSTHCVALGKYFVFGVNENGQMEYTVADYADDMAIDGALGELYSFDTNSIIRNAGKESVFTQSTLMESIKYSTRSVDEIKEDMYKSINSIHFDFSSLNIVDIFENNKELLSKVFGEEGVIQQTLNLTPNDIFSTDIFTKAETQDATTKDKWIVGVTCGVIFITSVALTVVCKMTEVPVAPQLLGAVAGAAAEAFVEVIIHNVSMNDIDYRKVLIAAVTGAIAVCTDFETMGAWAFVIDGMVAGIGEFAISFMDGETVGETIKNCALATAFAVVTSAIGEGISQLGSKIIAKFSKKATKEIGEAVVDGAKQKVAHAADNNAAEIGAKKAVSSVVGDAMDDALTATQKQALKYLPNPDNIKYVKYFDADGNESTKKVLNGFMKIIDDGSPQTQKLLKSMGKTAGEASDMIPINNGIPDFSSFSKKTIRLTQQLSMWRGTNFNRADKELARLWSENPDAIPQWAKEFFEANNIDPQGLKPTHINQMRDSLNLTWHETVDLHTMMLLPRELHNVWQGGISHMGAISLLKIAKTYSVPADMLSYVFMGA